MIDSFRNEIKSGNIQDLSDSINSEARLRARDRRTDSLREEGEHEDDFFSATSVVKLSDE